MDYGFYEIVIVALATIVIRIHHMQNMGDDTCVKTVIWETMICVFPSSVWNSEVMRTMVLHAIWLDGDGALLFTHLGEFAVCENLYQFQTIVHIGHAFHTVLTTSRPSPQ